MRIAERAPVGALSFPMPSFSPPRFSLGQEVKPPEIPGLAVGQNRILGFALANIASLTFGIVADYFIRERTDVSNKIVAGGTIAVSLVAILFSFRLTTLDFAIPISPFWRLLGGFFIYMNAVVLLRTIVDLFREKPEQPSFPKFAREILRI